jgi:HTH-type transcriptional regulator / antitoxin HigA
MAIGTTRGKREDRYLNLVRRFPLRPLRSDKELERATAIVDELTERLAELDAGEHDYLDILSDIIVRYEDEHFPIKPASDAVMLEHLLQAKGVAQAQLAKECGLAESTISEILAGKRKLNRIHIGKLARYFHVEPGVFSFED